MKFLRLEVFERDKWGYPISVYIREKPVFAKTERGARATQTRLINWAYRNFPDWTEVTVRPFELPRAAISQPIDSKGVTSP